MLIRNLEVQYMGRKRGHKKKRQIIGIYCEGKSEEQYFKMLSQKYNARNVHSQKLNIKSLGESGEKIITEAKLKGKIIMRVKYM